MARKRQADGYLGDEAAQGQLRREDPSAWRPLTMKPGMASAIAVHPSHPFVTSSGLVLPTSGPRTGGAGLARPVLMAKPKDFAWPGGEAVAIPGGEMAPKRVLFLVLDGLHLVQAAWAKGQSIEADVVPPGDVMGFVERNEKRSQESALPPEVAAPLSKAKTYSAIPGYRGKDRLTLAAIIEDLDAKGLPHPKRVKLLGDLGISDRTQRIARYCARAWQQYGITPEEANVHQWCIDDLKTQLRKRLRASRVPNHEAVILLAMPAFLKALSGLAGKLRHNHAVLKAEMPVPQFPPRILQAGMDHLGDQIVHLYDESLDEFPFEKYAREAAQQTAFHGLHGSWIKAVQKNQAVYASASLFRHYPPAVQLAALKACLAADGWASRFGARRYRDRLSAMAKIKA